MPPIGVIGRLALGMHVTPIGVIGPQSVNNTHDDYTNPLRVPMITGMQPKRQKKDVVTDAIASAVVRAFSPPPSIVPYDTATTVTPRSSTTFRDSTDTRMKNLQQLLVLQQLHDDNIITDTELAEQKALIMETLHNYVSFAIVL